LYELYHAGERLAGGDDLSRLAGGAALLRFGLAVLIGLRFLALYLAFRRVSASPAAATLGLIVLMILSVGGVAVLRPQVLGEFFFACLLLALSRPLLSRPMLVAVPLFLVLWANAHGSFVCGLVLLATVAAGRAVEALWLARRGQLPGLLADPQLRRLIVVLAASALAIAVLNPLGPGIYPETLRVSGHPNVLEMDEWQPLRFHMGSGGHWGYLAVAVLIVATQLFSRRWFAPTTLVLILCFAALPLLRQRMYVWWLMVAPWLMVRYWPECPVRLREWLASYHSVPCLRKTVVVVLLAVAALAWSIPGQWLLDGRPAPVEQAVTASTPWRLTHQLRHPESGDEVGLPALHRQLAAHYPGRRYHGTIFASETLGDLFIWDLAPRVPVFVYSHVHLFSAEHWQRVAAVRRGGPYWKLVLDAYRVNLVVVEPDYNANLCALLRQDGDWKVLVDQANDTKHRDPRQRLFVAVRVRPR
jgi:hypothetical protein